jgi:hypothetical protein
MATDAPTAIRRLRLDQTLLLLRAHTMTYGVYTLFPKHARLALEAAELAVNDPAVTLRIRTTTLTLADESGCRVHRFTNFPSSVVAVVADLAVTIDTALQAGWIKDAAAHRARAVCTECAAAATQFFAASFTGHNVDTAAVLQWAAQLHLPSSIKAGPPVQHIINDI